MFDKQFASQVGFSFMTISFCMYMIIHNPEASTISIFLPIICNLVGVFTPTHRSLGKPTDLEKENEETQPLKAMYESV